MRTCISVRAIQASSSGDMTPQSTVATSLLRLGDLVPNDVFAAADIEAGLNAGRVSKTSHM